jgi:membrane fusion protein (multidrug efflux system)
MTADPQPVPAGRPANGSSVATWFRALFLWGVPLLLVVAGVYWYGSGGRYVSTDNAYLKQDRVDVAPQISGNVGEVRVAENGHVEPGQVVLVLEDTLLRVAVEHAEAAVASARVDVAALQADYREKLGELALARDTSQYALREYERQRQLAASKLVPLTALDNAHHASTVAVGQIAVLELQVSQAKAKLGGAGDAPIDAHPQVRAALAGLEKARVDLGHTVITAPRTGVISHLPKVGDHVEAGQPAFAIVADGKLWVEANFQETDLEWLRPGQPARVKIDTYPGHQWQGRVESIAQATGAEFALLPAQNASGNWVKVVQRVPVRIAIDVVPGDPPLRSGMSADVSVDTGAHRRFDRWFAFLR